jgi:Flp pilus assembly protein TadD
MTNQSAKPQVTPDYEKVLYTPERVHKYMKGELTLRELMAYNAPEMLQMAIMGFQLYEQGKYQEARTIFHGLCDLEPKEAYYRIALGAIFLAEDNLENAEGCLNQAIKINPKELAAYVNRGEVYLKLGRVLEAAQDFKKATELDPQNKDPLTARARLLASAALESIANARKAAKKKKKLAMKGKK